MTDLSTAERRVRGSFGGTSGEVRVRLESIGTCGKCGGRRIEWFFGLRTPPWCPDCKTQLDGFPYRVTCP
jgi:hypothetical protein